MSFTYALSPVIVQLGPFSIRWYSLVYIVGFLLGYYFLKRAVKKGTIPNMTSDSVDEFIVLLILLSIVFSRITYVIIYNPIYFLHQPWKIFYIWEGGLSFHGGLIGAVIATIWFCKRRRVSFYKIADLLVLPYSFILIFGRLANFVNGELVGRTTTTLNWCINYPWLKGCRYPSQFYEAGKNLLVFLILLPLYTVRDIRERLKEGTIFYLFLLLYGLGRFLTDFYRAPDPTDFTFSYTGLIVGQYLSLIMVVIAVVVLLLWYAPRSESRVERNVKKRKRG